MSTLGIIDQHVKHVTVRPIGYRLLTFVFDATVLLVDPVKRTKCLLFICKNDVLRIANSREKSANGISRDFASEEEPINRAVECKLRSRSRKYKKHQIGIAPDPSNDRVTFDKISLGH